MAQVYYLSLKDKNQGDTSFQPERPGKPAFQGLQTE